MKFICNLPDSKNFSFLGFKDSRFVWQENESPYLWIYSDSRNIWGEQIIVVPKLEKAEPLFIANLILFCYQIDEQHVKTAKPVKIKRYIEAGNFVRSQGTTLFFYGFPTLKKNEYLIYSFHGCI